MKTPTIKIKSNNKQGYIIINKCDFDAKKHELFNENKIKKRTATKRARRDK